MRESAAAIAKTVRSAYPMHMNVGITHFGLVGAAEEEPGVIAIPPTVPGASHSLSILDMTVIRQMVI